MSERVLWSWDMRAARWEATASSERLSGEGVGLYRGPAVSPVRVRADVDGQRLLHVAPIGGLPARMFWQWQMRSRRVPMRQWLVGRGLLGVEHRRMPARVLGARKVPAGWHVRLRGRL